MLEFRYSILSYSKQREWSSHLCQLMFQINLIVFLMFVDIIFLTVYLYGNCHFYSSMLLLGTYAMQYKKDCEFKKIQT